MAEARAPQKSLPKINPVDRPFWEGAAKNKFLLQKCNSCGKVQFFPRVACVDCFGEMDWIEAKGTGKIHTLRWCACRATRRSKKRRRFIIST